MHSDVNMTGILPTYQRFVNGVPVPWISRRSFRIREKYLIVSALVTFAILWLGALFYLPEFKSSSSVNESVYNVYKRIQQAGPELLMPPPLAREDGDRHGADSGDDPHLLQDRDRLRQRIEQDAGLKVLERPQLDSLPSVSSSRGPGSLKRPPATAPDVEGADIKFAVAALGAGADTQKMETVREVKHCVTMARLRVLARFVFLMLAMLGTSSQVKSHPSFVHEASTTVASARVTAPDNSTLHQRKFIIQMMRHAWSGYKQYAWGRNEVKPVSLRAHYSSVFGAAELGASIVDALDTLYLMGLWQEFREGRDWVADHLNINEVDAELSVFETTIRFVGGLLSCFALTGDDVFRTKATEVADALLPAFDTPTGLPRALINPSTKASRQYHWAGSNSILSEVGTLHLEFTYLSDVTGNTVYREKVDRIRTALHNAEKPGGLYPNYINPRTADWGQRHTSLGALGDSFYEYLLKAWLQSGGHDVQAREMFDAAMQAALDAMLRVSPGGLSYLAELKYGVVFDEKMDHLSCFTGGMFALAATTLENSLSTRYMDVAERLTHTCHESYARAETKLGPEAFRFSGAVEARAQKSSEKVYLLRPETFESYFIMWRLTKQQKYRDWGWEAVQALEKHCRAAGGYTGLVNVYHARPQFDDVQQSFFLAETLKYLYLLFADDSILSLDEWVLNTEAHPLPIKGKNPLYRAASTSPQISIEAEADNKL